MLQLDLINTVAFGGIVLFIGYAIRNVIKPLARYNVPAPIVGGLLVAIAILIARRYGVQLFQFDTTLQSPLMIAFFTTIGFGASFGLLRVGGVQVLLFFAIATVFAILQNVIGALIAIPFGLNPLFGVLAGLSPSPAVRRQASRSLRCLNRRALLVRLRSRLQQQWLASFREGSSAGQSAHS